MKILGTGAALPKREVTNDMLAGFLETSDEWIRPRTGIESRRVITDETIDELAVEAAKKALAGAGTGLPDYIICSNVVNTHTTPGLSCYIAGELGASCPAVDINAACAGFIYALDLAESLLKAERAESILIVCAETMTRLADWTDRASCVLFGDGAGAVLVGRGSDLKALRLTCTPDRSLLYARSFCGNSPFSTEEPAELFLKMDGRSVFKFAVSSSSADMTAVMQEAGYAPEDVKYFITHQANLRIIRSIADKLKQPIERFPHNIERTGNTSSASIPILLAELDEQGRLSHGDKLIMSAFGGGLVTGACAIEWSK